MCVICRGTQLNCAHLITHRHDTELTDLVPFLTDLHHVDDVRSVLDAGLYQQMQFD